MADKICVTSVTGVPLSGVEVYANGQGRWKLQEAGSFRQAAKMGCEYAPGRDRFTPTELHMAHADAAKMAAQSCPSS